MITILRSKFGKTLAGISIVAFAAFGGISVAFAADSDPTYTTDSSVVTDESTSIPEETSSDLAPESEENNPDEATPEETEDAGLPVSKMVSSKAPGASPAALIGVVGDLQEWSHETNNPSYWESEGIECANYGSEQSTTDGAITDGGKTVTLNSIAPDVWVSLIVKGGSVSNNVIANPEVGVAYASPLNTGGQQSNVSHWIACWSTPPDTTPKATLSGVATCQADYTYSVLWTGTLSDYGALSEVDIKVIKHLPAGSLINGVDAQVWLFEWAEHSANHGLTSFPDGGVFTYTQTGIPGTATLATSSYQYDFKGGPSGDPEVTIELPGNCKPPVVEECTSYQQVFITSLDMLDRTASSTDGSSHAELTADGLLVWTDATGHRKAAGYVLGTDWRPLTEIGEFSIEWAGTANKPGGNILIDLDGNGTPDGFLVIESIYGGIQWLSGNWSGLDLTTGAPHVSGGGGYPNQGTFNDWLAAYPNAKWMLPGYSLGSGVTGYGVISSLKAGCIEYIPGLPPVVEGGYPLIDVVAQTCDYETGGLTGGSITVGEGEHVKSLNVYLQTDGGLVKQTDLTNLPPGSYTVIVVFDDGTIATNTGGWKVSPTSSSKASKTIVVEAGDCPVVVTITGGPSVTDPTCMANGTLVVSPAKGVVFAGGSNGDGPGNYVLTASAESVDYTLAGDIGPWPLTVKSKLTTGCPGGLAFTGTEIGGTVIGGLALLLTGLVIAQRRRILGFVRRITGSSLAA
jgi:hypothetical protein